MGNANAGTPSNSAGDHMREHELFHGSGNIGHELPEGVAASYILDDDKTIRCEKCVRMDLMREEL
ncbi:hypothetical protein N7536_009320 [Penicillium majusculum]|nr:hypothetical protein N7536_009320 [Penicillium majusculum]